MVGAACSRAETYEKAGHPPLVGVYRVPRVPAALSLEAGASVHA